MTENKKQIIKNYPYQIAGKTWNINKVIMQKGISGSLIFPRSEVSRMNFVVAKEICGSYSPLSGQELDFLCDLTTTKFVEISKIIGISKGTVSKLVSQNTSLAISQSIQLKKLFWARIFGTGTLEKIPASLIFDEIKLLEYLKKEAEKLPLLKAV